MSYESTRDSLEGEHFDKLIEAFATKFYQRVVDPASRRTIILFPGGMGSSLIRGTQAFSPVSPNPNESYEDLWLTVSLFLWGLDALGMDGDIDSDERFIIADSTIQVCGVGPYDQFTEWCDTMQLDLLVFPYDWRRRPGYSVDAFVNVFLTKLQAAVPECMNDLTLIGHSLGGMTVKLVLQEMVANQTPIIKRYITVGSPFYGYFGQTIRYFEGEPEFFLESKKDVATLIASLEGGYFLQLMDEATYNAHQVAFQNDTYPLTSYPSTDANQPNVAADPFNPVDDPANQLFRYPEWVKADYLALGLTDYQQVAEDLPCDALQNFYNIRAVQAVGDVPKSETNVAQSWQYVTRPFDPDGPSAITFAGGPGDGTIPAWSARLLSLQACWPDNVVTLLGDLEHMSLMESDAVQSQIYQILGLGSMVEMEMRRAPTETKPDRREGTIVNAGERAGITVASVREAGAFVKGLQRIINENRTRGPVAINRRLRDYLEEFPRARRVALARGIIAAAAGGRYGSHPRR